MSQAGAIPVLELTQDLRGQELLTPAQIIEDLNSLRTAATRAYAGPDFLSSLDDISTEAQSSAQFCDQLAKVFSNVSDAHLRASLYFKNCGDSGLRGQVGRNVGGDSWRVQTMQIGQKEIAVLAIPRFFPKADSRWQGFLQAVEKIKAQGQPFILDLRGNVGGDDHYGFEMARVLLNMPADQNLPGPVALRKIRQTPEAFAVQVNAWTVGILRLQARGQSVPAFMLEKRAEVLEWMTRAQYHQFPDIFSEILPEQKINLSGAIQAPVYILVDRECASACETTLQVLENLPNRILVGENTAGAVHFGDVGRAFLPNSRVLVSLATSSVEFHDRRQIEKQGYAPSVPVEAGKDALTELARTF